MGWFKQHPWLSLCETRHRLFCFYCQCAKRRKLVKFSTKGEHIFSKTGFYNWKKAGERFCKHEGSQVHAESCMKIKNVDVSVMLAEGNRVQQEIRCKMLLKQLTPLSICLGRGWQYVAILRGRAIYYSYYCCGLRMTNTYLHGLGIRNICPLILNEQIRLMADFVLRAFLSDIRSSLFWQMKQQMLSLMSKCV